MSEFGGLWKHKNIQHALVSQKTECGFPSGGGINNGHIRYPLLLKNAERKKICVTSYCSTWFVHTMCVTAYRSMCSVHAIYLWRHNYVSRVLSTPCVCDVVSFHVCSDQTMCVTYYRPRVMSRRCVTSYRSMCSVQAISVTSYRSTCSVNTTCVRRQMYHLMCFVQTMCVASCRPRVFSRLCVWRHVVPRV